MRQPPIDIRAYYDAHVAPTRLNGPRMLVLGFIFAALFGIGMAWIIAKGL